MEEQKVRLKQTTEFEWAIQMLPDWGILSILVDDLLIRLRTHIALANAHHEPYTDAQVQALINVHAAISGAHHSRYTNSEAVDAMGAKADANPLHHDRYADSEAVSAVADADDYVKIVGDTMTGNLIMMKTYYPSFQMIFSILSSGSFVFNDDAGQIGFFSTYGRSHHTFPGAVVFGNVLDNVGYLSFGTQIKGRFNERMAIENDGKLNINNNPIKNPKNLAHSALSGTKKLVEIDINGVPYYFEVSPTKA